MAARYWVGGTGTWDASSTTNWSATSGGLGGASAPTSADTVTFDTLSGTGTCTTASGAVCSSCTMSSLLVNLTLGANLTMSGTFTLTNNTLTLGSNTLQCNIFSSNNSNTRAIAFGTGKINVTGNGVTIFDFTTATNFTYTGTSQVNFTYSGATGTRTCVFGTGATESNVLNYNVTGGTDTFAQGNNFKNLDFTGFSGSALGNASSQMNCYGNLTLSSTMTVSSSAVAVLAFSATSGTQVFTTNGIALEHPITINGTSTVQLGSALTIGLTRTLTLTTGTFDANNYNVTTGLFSSQNSNIRTIKMGSGTWTILASGTNWSTLTTTNLTLTANTSTVNFTSTSAKLMANGFGLTYYNIVNSGTGAFTLFNGGAFNNVTSLAGCPITFTSGQAYSSNTFTFVGTPSAPITIAPSSTTNYTLTKLGGGIVDMQNVSISRCTASLSTGTWYAGASTDGGNNTGIRFVSAPKFQQMF